MNATTPAPALLVSLRSVEELEAALDGGADLIDVKDPDAGSLGRPSFRTIEDIANALRQEAPGVPLSVALGELSEWDAAAVPLLPSNVRWVKVGLSGCALEPEWIDRWRSARAQLERFNPQVGWIAVAYADHLDARAPSPREVLDAAIETHCPGVLLDTFTKEGQRLGDWMGVAELRDWLRRARKHGLLTALAGSLRRTDLKWLRPLAPEVIAIRSAACVDRVRTAGVDALAVARFKSAISHPDPPPAR